VREKTAGSAARSNKRRNVAEHLPKTAQGDYDRRIRNAYAMTEYAAAKAELEKIFRQLERINPSAARSLEKGLEETLTVHGLGVGWLLRRTLTSTNPIESCLSTVERVARNVKRWRQGEQALRWTATGLLEAQRNPACERLPGTGAFASPDEPVVDSTGAGRVTSTKSKAAAFN
jgi:transposase-like protein